MGVRKFMPVSPAIWNRRVLELGKDVVIVYLYLLTNKHRLSEGLYYLPIAYMVGDLGGLNLGEDDIKAAVDALDNEGLITYDGDVDVVFLPDALQLLPPRSPSQLNGAIKKLLDVPRSPLLERLYQRAVFFCAEPKRKGGPTLPQKLEEAFPELLDSFSQAKTVEELSADASPNTIDTHTRSAESESESAVTRWSRSQSETCQRCDFNPAQVKLPDGTRLCEVHAKSNEVEPPDARTMDLDAIKATFNAEEVEDGTGGEER